MTLVTNGRLITRDSEGKGYYEHGAVAYEGANIIEVGEEAALRAEIEQDRLYSFSLRTVSYKWTDSPTLLPSLEFAVRKLSESGKTDGETGGEIRLVYRDGTAVWSVGFIAARRLSGKSMFFAVR